MNHSASIRLLAVWMVLAWSAYATAGPVSAGFDLLTTEPGAFFDLDGPGPFPPVPMLGVPITTYDFGGGPVAVGSTDTIVERLAPASGPGIDTIPIEMVSLQLVSAVPVPLAPLGGAGMDFIGATLSSDRGRHGSDPPPGAGSTGSMDIDFDTSTFLSSIMLTFDLREGGVSGPILPLGADMIKMIFNPTPIPWVNTFGSGKVLEKQFEVSNPPGFTFHPFIATPDSGGSNPNAPLIIPGVNSDFIVGVVITPEPATTTLVGLGMFAAVLRRRRAGR